MSAIDGYKTYLTAAGSVLAAMAIWALHIWGVSGWGVPPETAAQLPSVGDATLLFWAGLALVGIRSAADKVIAAASGFGMPGAATGVGLFQRREQPVQLLLNIAAGVLETVASRLDRQGLGDAAESVRMARDIVQRVATELRGNQG